MDSLKNVIYIQRLYIEAVEDMNHHDYYDAYKKLEHAIHLINDLDIPKLDTPVNDCVSLISDKIKIHVKQLHSYIYEPETTIDPIVDFKDCIMEPSKISWWKPWWDYLFSCYHKLKID